MKFDSLSQQARYVRTDDAALVASGARELAICEHCAGNTPLDFGTDMHGRVVEHCPACGHRKVYDPRGK